MFGRRRFLSFPLVIGAVVLQIIQTSPSILGGKNVEKIGVVSGKAIFGPPLDDYWKKKLKEEAAAKENKQASHS